MSLIRSIVSSSRALVSGAKDAARFRQIASVFIKHGFGWAFAHLAQRRELELDVDENTSKEIPLDHRDTGQRLVRALTDLGPTWIKFGQILSTRPDLLPSAITEELANLQDNVRVENFAEMDTQLRNNLGDDYAQHFATLDKEPLASASIGQVHRATLKSGEEVVLKIQRPDISGKISSDLNILHTFAGYAEEAFVEAQAMDIRGIVQDFAKSMSQELDYRAELSNLQRFRRNFEDRPDIYFPKVYPELSTEEVLCMEFISGTKLTTLIEQGGDTDPLIELYFDAAYQMLFVDGFFHGDLHPGNVLVLENNHLALIDCGMVGRLVPTRKEKVIDILWAVLNEDLESLARTFYSLAIPQGPVEYDAFERDAVAIAERYIGGVPLAQVHIGELFGDLVAAATKHKVRMPTDFTMMFKAIATTEGLARTLAPHVDPIELARPYVTKMISERYNPERLQHMLLSDAQMLSRTLRALPRSLPFFLDSLRQGRLSLGISDHTTQQLIEHTQQLQNRWIRTALAIGALITGAMVLPYPALGQIAGLSYLSLGFWSVAALLIVTVLLLPGSGNSDS